MNRGGLAGIVGVAALATGIVGGVLAERQGVIPWPHKPQDGASSSPAGAETAEEPEAASPEPVVTVRVAPAEVGSISGAVEMIGAVEMPPGATFSRTLACDVIVRKVFVIPGQRVTAGTRILRVEPTQSVRNELAAAESDVLTAQAELDAARARLDAKLGTHTEVVQAEQQLRASQVVVASLTAVLPPEGGVVTADHDGVVLSIGPTPGAVLPAGDALFEVSDTTRASVRFGVPTESIKDVLDAAKVSASALLAESLGTLDLGVDRIEPEVDPASRMSIAWTNPVGHDDWRPGTPVLVAAPFASPEGILVPRAALVLTDDGLVVFVARDGKAELHPATLLAGDAEKACIHAQGVAAGDSVVILGGHELHDGAAIRAEAGS